MGVFFRRSRADNSVVGGPIWPKFELVRDIMHVLVTYKFKMDLINSDREKVTQHLTSRHIWFTEGKDSFRPSASPVLADYTKNFPFNLSVECALVCNPGAASRPATYYS